MGAVYKARQPQLDRFVALKILSHDLAGDPAFVERFNREARVLARLSHPNIVGIHDFGTAGPYCYLLMEYVDGVNLRQAMRAGRFTPTEALAMVQHLCSALKFAHEEGILHRDIKPENILIDSKGRVKIADFGIAKLVGEDRQHDVTLTLQGSVLGSPHYMAPEQIETPGDVDQRADIYSLGVVLYEMLTGELPIGRFALPSEKAAMDARIDDIVMRTLEKEREARYQSAGEVGTEVEAVTKNPAPLRHEGRRRVTENREPPASAWLPPILTGISLVLASSSYSINMSVSTSRIQAIPAISSQARHVHSRSACGIMAIIGFILGARALGEIRRSGGVKTGLGLSIFAVTAWPILLLFPLATAFIYIPIPGQWLIVGSLLGHLHRVASCARGCMDPGQGALSLGRGRRRERRHPLPSRHGASAADDAIGGHRPAHPDRSCREFPAICPAERAAVRESGRESRMALWHSGAFDGREGGIGCVVRIPVSLDR